MPIDASEKRSEGSFHIDALRGAAAILVMLGHSREYYFESLTGGDATAPTETTGAAAVAVPAPGWIGIGTESVMIFFVLSGYLVGGTVVRSVQRKRWSWKEYLGKRLTRLWLVLLPALVLTLVLDQVGLRLFPESNSIYRNPPIQNPGSPLVADTLTPRVFVGNALFAQNIIVPNLGTNSALWSLANEFWYYMAFPLLILGCWRSTTIGVRLVCSVLIASIAYFVGGDIIALFPIWLLGAGVALLPLKLSDRSSRTASILLGLLLPLVMLLLRRIPMDAHLAQACMGLYTCVLIYVFASRTAPAQRGLYQRIATLLSNLSYPLYLIHVPILVLVAATINRPFHVWSKTPGNLALVFGLDVFALIAAYVFHLCFQQHTESVRRWLLGPLRHQQHVPVARDAA
jgi:peptidoglycan/LPS O-acetylase OafA/YrhL